MQDPASRRDGSIDARFARHELNVRELEQSRNLHPAGHGPELVLHALIDFARRFVDGRDHQVLEHLHIIRIDSFFVDRDGQQLLVAVHRRLDHTAASTAFDLQLRHALLHLRLHGLDLLHHLFRVHFDLLDSTISPPRCFAKDWTTGSSRKVDGRESAEPFAAWGLSTSTFTLTGEPKSSVAISSMAFFASLTESA